jgi:hypothetical protein
MIPSDGGFKVYYVTGDQDFVQGTATAPLEAKISVMREMEPSPQLHAKGRQRNSAYAKDSGLVIVRNGAGDVSLVEPIVVKREYPALWTKVKVSHDLGRSLRA